MQFAAQLYAYRHISAFVAFISRKIVISLVMYLTLAKVQHSFFKTFTLNLLALYIPYSFITTAEDVRQIEMLYVTNESQAWFLSHYFLKALFFDQVIAN